MQPCLFVTYIVCENFEVWIFFCGFFLCGEFVGKIRNLDGNLDYMQKSKAALVAKRFLQHENEIARLNIMREQGVQSNSQFIAGCKFTGFR